jgi:hypothetical protein
LPSTPRYEDQAGFCSQQRPATDPSRHSPTRVLQPKAAVQRT